LTRALSFRFIDSEADLDAAIQSLLPLAQSPALAYPELIKSAVVATLVDLMSHENVDIVIDVVSLLHELTDEDVGGEDEDDGSENDLEAGTLGKNNQALKLLIDGLVCGVFRLHNTTNTHFMAFRWNTKQWNCLSPIYIE
jgi:beta-catenin-like protein 1